MGRFGDELRSKREQKRVTLETICAVTKVSVRHLEALESDHYSELPGGVFRKGILRSYLGAVGLEESPWMERFDAALRESGAVQADGNDWVEFAENVRRNRGGVDPGTGSRWIGVAAMAGTLVMLGWGVWKFVLHGHLFL
jgi:cytoskeleton protein RodZ